MANPILFLMVFSANQVLLGILLHSLANMASIFSLEMRTSLPGVPVSLRVSPHKALYIVTAMGMPPVPWAGPSQMDKELSEVTLNSVRYRF